IARARSRDRRPAALLEPHGPVVCRTDRDHRRERPGARADEAMSDDASGVLPFIRAMLRAVAPYRGRAVLIFLGLTLEMAVNALVPLSFKVLIDEALPTRDRHVLVVVVGALGAGVVVLAAGGLLRDRLYAEVSGRLLADLRLRIFEHLQTLS